MSKVIFKTWFIWKRNIQIEVILYDFTLKYIHVEKSETPIILIMNYYPNNAWNLFVNYVSVFITAALAII